MPEEIKQLKGGKFLNRYVIKAKLTALTPFHIGDGSKISRTGMVDDTGGQIQINAVATDGNKKAYIPGSALKGALRDWLRQGNEGMTETAGKPSVGEEINKIRSNKNLSEGQKDDEITEFIKKNFSALELIFGSQQNEGKLEAWDAYCCSPKIDEPTDEKGQMCFWHKDRIAYVAKSVAINPLTGTAEEGKLYNYELVPKGAEFAATFSAQNLTDEEVEILMAVLNGFEHKNNPIVLGAMTKLDFGRFKIDISEIYCLDNIDTWRGLAAKDTQKRAGYDLIIDSEFDMKVKNPAKFTKLSDAKLPDATDVSIHSEKWTLKLETPLVVRSGGRFVWKNAASKKTRNYRMEYNWGETKKTGEFHHVSDLYHSVEIVGNQVIPYYHVPSSSVRGALSDWTIKHLLSREWWNIEDKLKKGDLSNKPQHLDDILTLFGFAVDSSDHQITEKYTRAGRLIIGVKPFSADAPKPTVDGVWDTASNNYGPKNAQRHVKPRNPLDRVTQAAKDTGLHHNLEFSKGQKLVVEIRIINPNEFDRKLLGYWKDDVLSGMIRLGGLAGIGRGRLIEFKNTTEGGSNV